MMTELYRCITLVCAALIASASAFAQPPERGQEDDQVARSILEKADQIRFPKDSFVVDIDIVSTAEAQADEARKYRVLSRGNENTVVQILEPASERGQIMLMKGRDLWVFLPNVSQPVRLALSQRLTGEVANGDLARTNFTGDYNPRLLRTDTLDGEKYHVLELSAVDRGVTYHRVLFWVHQASNRPHRAEFYSLSDRLLKVCHYQGYKSMAGKVRPTKLVMEDALKKGEISTLAYNDMKLRDLPEKMFTKEYLKKLTE